MGGCWLPVVPALCMGCRPVGWMRYRARTPRCSHGLRRGSRLGRGRGRTRRAGHTSRAWPCGERDRRGSHDSAARRPNRDSDSTPTESGSPRRRRVGAVGVRSLEQLSGPFLAPRTGPCGAQGLVSGLCFIISAAKRHQVLVQTLGKQRHDVAVLRRGGLKWVFRSSPPLAIEDLDPIACLAPEQGKISILGIRIDGGQHIRATRVPDG